MADRNAIRKELQKLVQSYAYLIEEESKNEERKSSSSPTEKPEQSQNQTSQRNHTKHE